MQNGSSIFVVAVLCGVFGLTLGIAVKILFEKLRPSSKWKPQSARKLTKAK